MARLGTGLPILYASGPAGSCITVGNQHDVVSYGASPQVSGAPQGGDATGEAAGTGPITLCCLP